MRLCSSEMVPFKSKWSAVRPSSSPGKGEKKHVLTAASVSHSQSCLTLAAPRAILPSLRHYYWGAWTPPQNISQWEVLICFSLAKLIQKPRHRSCLWTNSQERLRMSLLLCSRENLVLCASICKSQTLLFPFLSAARTRRGPVASLWL